MDIGKCVKLYRIRVLNSSLANPTVCLPEFDGVIVTSSRENNLITTITHFQIQFPQTNELIFVFIKRK